MKTIKSFRLPQGSRFTLETGIFGTKYLGTSYGVVKASKIINLIKDYKQSCGSYIEKGKIRFEEKNDYNTFKVYFNVDNKGISIGCQFFDDNDIKTLLYELL